MHLPMQAPVASPMMVFRFSTRYSAIRQCKRLLHFICQSVFKAFITNNGINAGKTAEKLDVIGSPAIAEEVMVARDCMLALRSGAAVVIQHISSANSVELVRTAKKLGADIHAEATPHHFTLTEEALLKHGTLAKMNPPLRAEKDRLAIIEGLKDGTIDLIATDHAPHSMEETAYRSSERYHRT